MAYSASFICQTQSVGSTLIHSSVLYCFALLICITQRKVSSFFLLVIHRFAQSVKAKRKDARCAVLFLLLYSAKLCLASRPRMKVEMRRFNFLYCFSSLTQLHSASPPFASFVTFSYIKSQLHKTCILSFFSCLYLLSVFWVLQTNILSSFFVLFFFGTSNPSEKLFASLRNIKYPLDFLNTYSH